NAARPILEQLRAGGAVGILMDQNVLEGDANVFALFFGRLSVGLEANSTSSGAEGKERADWLFNSVPH
ncbi:MAG: hypothetical protein L0220_11925, partial [Acidobacteria bacterium]|nr:hypothetical protein [Acidobacteriota bacterium]